MKKNIIRFGLLMLSIGLLPACTSVSVTDYASNSPKLVLQEFFNGSLRAHGMVKDRSGKVIRYFNATIDASWQNGIGTLDENFVFDDGEKQQRIWTIIKDDTGQYIGTASDVVGKSQLSLAGNSLFLNYVLRIPYDDGTLDLKIDDRMYLVSKNVLMNESVMTKWGFQVGEIVLVIEKDVSE
jgi:hypothetical protein|tara:strand:- start:1908 stop:2453 length:546 start_codon:yes stop_codon:yes gene_type:complete